jgi:hypothetical protein
VHREENGGQTTSTGRKMPKTIENDPPMMKAVVLKKFVEKYSHGKEALSECFEVKQVPRPKPGWNQVLVKVQRAQVS